MKSAGSSIIEYQGISIVKKDYKTIEKLVKEYYPEVKDIKKNLHICLNYYGNDHHIDKHLAKEESLFPEKALGKQLKLKLTAIADYKKDGKLMNIAFLVNDACLYDTVLPNGKILAEYNTSDLLILCVYVAEGTYTDEKGRIRPVTAVKKSVKCFFNDALKENESNHFTDLKEEVEVLGELADFCKQTPIFRVHNDSSRIITNKSIFAAVNELNDAVIVNEREKEEAMKAQEVKNSIFN